MTYLSFDDESDMLPEDRHAEAVRIIRILIEQEPDNPYTLKEREFLTKMLFAAEVSQKQLYYLRDIKEKYASA